MVVIGIAISRLDTSCLGAPRPLWRYVPWRRVPPDPGLITSTQATFGQHASIIHPLVLSSHQCRQAGDVLAHPEGRSVPGAMPTAVPRTVGVLLASLAPVHRGAPTVGGAESWSIMAALLGLGTCGREREI